MDGGALSAARTSSNTSARGPVPARVPRECKINVLGRPTRAILELLLMLSQPLWFPCSRFGLKRPTSTRLTFILGPIMKYHHFMGPGMLGTCWGIIRYQFWNENPLLLLENQALKYISFAEFSRCVQYCTNSKKVEVDHSQKTNNQRKHDSICDLP